MRTTFRLTLRCDNRCVFCAQRGVRDQPDEDPELLGTRLELERSFHDAITFAGGEPTTYSALPFAVSIASALGFRAIGIQTNGRRLADARLTGALADAGLTDVHVSVHGARAEVHDYHTAVDGSFDALWAGVANARARGLVVAATTVLTRSGFRVIGELPALLASRGVAAWAIQVPRAAGDAITAFDRVVPRLGLALPYALHALSAAAELGLPAWIRGAPLCALGPFAARALPETPARGYGEACVACEVRARCAGVDELYLRRFGEGELSRKSARDVPAAVASDSELAEMFVGIGELGVPGELPAVEPPPERVRVSLPVLGKVRRAAAEVGRSEPRRTGHELREILPGLFDGDADRDGE